MDRNAAAYQPLSGLYILPLKNMGGHIARWPQRLRGQPDWPWQSV